MESQVIQVIADKKLAKFARQLVHGISKSELLDASFYTLEQYRDNEVTMSSKVYRIFLGKNKISKAYIDLIHEKYNRHGVIWGYDASAAVIYVNENPDDLKSFTEEFNDTLERIKNKVGQNSPLVNVGLASVADFLAIPLVFQVVPLVWGANSFKNLLKAKEEQYKLGILTFLEQGLDQFVDVGD